MIRLCFACGRDLGHVGGYSLARDAAAFFAGKENQSVREICTGCVLTGRAIAVADFSDAFVTDKSYPWS